MSQPFSIGGVKIYPNNSTNIEVLEKEDGKNVIKYNGITIKFPNQENKKVHGDMVEPKINTFQGATEIWYCKDLEVYGSENDDKINAYGNLNSIFNIENGGADVLNVERYSDSSYPEQEQNIKDLRLDENDTLNHSYCEYDSDHNLQRVDTYTSTGNPKTHKAKFIKTDAEVMQNAEFENDVE